MNHDDNRLNVSQMYPTLFAAPKQGGILQSSGFLDFKSLMVLRRTAKATMFDEISLIQSIENELTTRHQVRTIEEALAFWRTVYGNLDLEDWIQPRGTPMIIPSFDVMRGAVKYEVMLTKMLRLDPKCVQTLNEQCFSGFTILHSATTSPCNTASVKAILNMVPESQRLQIVSKQCKSMHCNPLHWVSNLEPVIAVLEMLPASDRSHVMSMPDIYDRSPLIWTTHPNRINDSSIETLMDLLPESERFQVVSAQDKWGMTALHCAVKLHNHNYIKIILSKLPESQRSKVVCLQYNRDGSTILHWAADEDDLESIKTILGLLPESHRLQVVSVQDTNGITVLHYASSAICDLIKELLRKPRRSPRAKRLHSHGRVDEAGRELPEAKRQKS